MPMASMSTATAQQEARTSPGIGNGRDDALRKCNRITLNVDDAEIAMLAEMRAADGEPTTTVIRRAIRERYARMLQEASYGR
jgi:hypothetical protein